MASKRRIYIMQQHAGLLLLSIGIIALFFPATRRIMQLPDPLEWLLFAGNTITGVVLLRCKSRRLLDAWVLLAVAFCAATAIAYTFSLGVNTGSAVYILEIYFLIRLLGRVRADRVHDDD